MTLAELEEHLRQIGHVVEVTDIGGQEYIVIKEVRVPAGTHVGESCEVALLRSRDNPWLPEAKVHVRPHLTPMGQHSSQGSPLGPDWQYLSRRFDRPPTPQKFYAHLLTVIGEL